MQFLLTFVKIYIKKIFFIAVFTFFSFDLIFVSIAGAGKKHIDSKDLTPLNIYSPSKSETQKLKFDVANNIKGQINKIFASEKQIQDNNVIHLSFPSGVSGTTAWAYISFLDHEINDHLQKSSFYHEHFKPSQQGFAPLACYPGYTVCTTIQSDFVLDGDYSISSLKEFVNVLNTSFPATFFITKTINIWNDMLKNVIKNNLDKLIDNSAIGNDLKTMIKDKINFYSDASNLVNLLSMFDPNNKYHIKLAYWGHFLRYFKTFSDKNITNVHYSLDHFNDTNMTVNVNLFPKDFIKVNNKDISTANYQVSYRLNHKNNQFFLTNDFIADNLYFDLFLRVLSFI